MQPSFFEKFLATNTSAISLPAFLFHFLVAALLSHCLCLLYTRCARTYSNRPLFARNFVVITLATLLIISIIKSSLALSLGLVGALSIVRFRAAIKEPEELTYLFLCIAIGLGLGAGQTVVTVLGFLLIVAYILLRDRAPGNRAAGGLLITISTPQEADTVAAVMQIVQSATTMLELKRLDADQERVRVVLHGDLADATSLTRLHDDIRAKFPQGSITVLDESVAPL